MEKYYVIKHPRQQAVEVISQDASEMYYFSKLPTVDSSKKTMIFFWLSLLISIPFSLFYRWIPLKIQTPTLIAAAMATFATMAAFFWIGRTARREFLNSYPMERNHFIPTKHYLKRLQRKLLLYSALMFFAFVVMCWSTKVVFFNYIIMIDLKETFWDILFFVFSPTILFAFLIASIEFLIGFISIRRYETVNEDRLAADGPIVFPSPVPGVPLPDSSQPMVFLRQLKIDKCVGGYRIEDVDTYLAKLQDKLRSGEPIYSESIRRKSFHMASLFKTGYNISTVDAALDMLAERLEDKIEL